MLARWTTLSVGHYVAGRHDSSTLNIHKSSLHGRSRQLMSRVRMIAWEVRLQWVVTDAALLAASFSADFTVIRRFDRAWTPVQYRGPWIGMLLSSSRVVLVLILKHRRAHVLIICFQLWAITSSNMSFMTLTFEPMAFSMLPVSSVLVSINCDRFH